MLPAPSDPDTCAYFKYHPATWGYSGGSPPETECTHPEGSGDCCEEDCPFAREGEEPTTKGDLYDEYCDRKFEEAREAGWDR